jgi:hypothetical protein
VLGGLWQGDMTGPSAATGRCDSAGPRHVSCKIRGHALCSKGGTSAGPNAKTRVFENGCQCREAEVSGSRPLLQESLVQPDSDGLSDSDGPRDPDRLSASDGLRDCLDCLTRMDCPTRMNCLTQMDCLTRMNCLTQMDRLTRRNCLTRMDRLIRTRMEASQATRREARPG